MASTSPQGCARTGLGFTPKRNGNRSQQPQRIRIFSTIHHIAPTLAVDFPRVFTSEQSMLYSSKTYVLAEKMPGVISDESVTETPLPASRAKKAACLACPDPGPIALRVEKYNCIILAHPAQDRRLALEEYRTDRDGRPVPGDAAPRFRRSRPQEPLSDAFCREARG